MRITPKNWADFQHYKDRDPPWIKLHKKLLDDYEFQSLPVASRALAPMLWLLASEDKDGVIEANEVKLAFRFRISVGELTDALMPLIQANFFSVERDASEVLAPCTRAAMPEAETQVKAQVQANTLPAGAGGASVKTNLTEGFEEFYIAYQPTRNAKRPEALKAWISTAKTRPPLHELLRAVAAYNSWLAEESRKQKREYPKQHPSTWLRGEVWNGYLTPAVDPEAIASAMDRADRLLKRGKYDPQNQHVTA